MLKLPRIDDYIESSNKMVLPRLLVDKEYTIKQYTSPITDGTEMDNLCTDTVMRQRMRKNSKGYVTSSKEIIDDLLLHSSSLSLLLLLFECYLRIDFKYRQSFRFPKCKFLLECFEFIGNDIIPLGNSTAKLNMV